MSNLAYKGKEIFVGIDVHLKSWDIQVMTQNRVHKQIHKANPSPLELVTYLKQNYPGGKYRCVYESGFCGYWIQEELMELGVDTIVANAADIPTSDKDRRFKDDRVDSKKLAIALRSGELDGIFVPPKQQQKDRNIVRQRYDLSSRQRSIKNKIKTHLHFYGIEFEEFSYWSKQRIEQFEVLAQQDNNLFLKLELKALRQHRKYILEAETNMRALAKEPRYSEDYEIVRSMTGIGPLGAMVWLTEIGDVARFENIDKLISYIGLTPSCRKSGEKEYVGRISKRGNKRARTTLINASWVAIGLPNKLSSFYEHCRTDLKKNANKSIILVAKKMVKILYAMQTKRTKYVKY